MSMTKSCDRHPVLDHMTSEGCVAIIQMMPAVDWYVDYDVQNIAADGSVLSVEVVTYPLIGWGVRCNGTVVPLECADGMRVDDASASSGSIDYRPSTAGVDADGGDH